MTINLELENIPKEEWIPFCNYIINKLTNETMNKFQQDRAENIQNYINDNHLIDWRHNKNKKIDILDIYRLALSSLKTKIINETTIQIYLDTNLLIPDSYTTINSMINLLENGTLSVRKYRLLEKIITELLDNLNGCYVDFKLENER